LIRSAQVRQTDAGGLLGPDDWRKSHDGRSKLRFARRPIEDFLIELHQRVSSMRGGNVADYIPELGKANPDTFGIALATVDGEIYSTGDDEHLFTIQSVSKPFMYGYALQHYGRDYVLRHVGVEPTGEAFNSIVLDEVANRPFNPMLDAGAIAVAALMPGNTPEERIATMLDLFCDLAGRRLEIDQPVFQSEHATGHRSRAIAYLMLNTGMIERDPIDSLDLYFRQCSITINCRDLAMMAATLANDGVNPTGASVYDPHYVRDVLSVMNSCGMYNAGQWSYEVGMPPKSGVSGCIWPSSPARSASAFTLRRSTRRATACAASRSARTFPMNSSCTLSTIAPVCGA
jgi:glutaminase